MKKLAPTDYVVHPLIESRWSPRAFLDQHLSEEQTRSIFEAARWAPSARNEQPWRFIAAGRRNHSKQFKDILLALDEGNQEWAVNASMLVVSFAKTTYAYDGSQNTHAWYDVGQATALLSLQANQYGISIHQMGGFDADKIREDFKVPEEFDAIVAMALGFIGNPKTLSPELEKRERAPRERLSQRKLVFGKRWDSPFVG